MSDKKREDMPLMFSRDLLVAWGNYLINTKSYKKAGMSYIEALQAQWVFQNDPLSDDNNYDMLKLMHKLLGVALEMLDKERGKEEK